MRTCPVLLVVLALASAAVAEDWVDHLAHHHLGARLPVWDTACAEHADCWDACPYGGVGVCETSAWPGQCECRYPELHMECQCGGDKDGGEDICSVYCKLPRLDWYWGNVTRLEVEYLLLKYPGNFIIRASSDTDHILCLSFRVDPESCLKGPSSFSHMTLKHYKGLFSLDRKDYVPVDKIPEHCEKVGKDMNIFKATALRQTEETVLEMSKIFCKQRK